MALFRCGGTSGVNKLRGYHRNYVESSQTKHSWLYINGKGETQTGTASSNDPLVALEFLGSSRYKYTAKVALWYNGVKYNVGDVVIASASSGYYYFAEA